MEGESLHFLRSMWLWMSPLCSRLAIFYILPRPGRQKNGSLFNCCAESLHFYGTLAHLEAESLHFYGTLSHLEAESLHFYGTLAHLEAESLHFYGTLAHLDQNLCISRVL